MASVWPNPASSGDILLAYFVSQARGIKFYELADVGLAEFDRVRLRSDVATRTTPRT